MYIEPGTNIKILKNCPLDNTYEHTIYFDSASTQSTYFTGLAKYNLTNYTYQRVNKGVARVGVKADNLYDCNYMMFQNTNYGTKWFYAFIKNVEYVNNDTSEITFEIDVMQTWMFDYTVDTCFVEREHAVTDGYTNLQPEPVNLGEPVLNTTPNSAGTETKEGFDPVVDLSDLCVIFNVIDVTNLGQGRFYDGVYGAGSLTAFLSTDLDGINTFLNSYAQKTDNIIAVYTCPRWIIQESVTAGGTVLTEKQISKHLDVNLSVLSLQETVGGYVPKNKKLFTYPYNYIVVTNANGDSLTLRYEYFTNNRPQLRINGCVSQPVQMVLRPRNYKGAEECFSESISLGNFPMCSWAIDGYQAFIAQTAIPTGISVIGNALGGGLVAGLTGGVGSAMTMASTAGNAIGNIGNLLAQGYKAAVGNDVSKGSYNSSNANVSQHTNMFYWGRMSVNANYAEVIDNFFDKFGYATNRLKHPNTHSRPHWNYVKTRACTLTGSVPADDMRKLCSIYDNGVTFWMNGSEVGDYTLDNRPNS